MTQIVGDISEWIKFFIAALGMAFGYGVLKAKVEGLREDAREHKTTTAKRFLRLEFKVDEAEKVLEGLKVSTDAIDKRTDRMDNKLDRLLERKI